MYYLLLLVLSKYSVPSKLIRNSFANVCLFLFSSFIFWKLPLCVPYPVKDFHFTIQNLQLYLLFIYFNFPSDTMSCGRLRLLFVNTFCRQYTMNNHRFSTLIFTDGFVFSISGELPIIYLNFNFIHPVYFYNFVYHYLMKLKRYQKRNV